MSNSIKDIVINSTCGADNSAIESYISGWFAAMKLRVELAQCDINLTHICLPFNELKPTSDVITLNIQQIGFLRSLGISEKLLMNTCAAHHSLGRRYIGWQSPDHDFTMVEGEYGQSFSNVKFQHFAHSLDASNQKYDAFAIAANMAKQGKFVHPVADHSSVLSTYTYSLNVNAFRFGELLMKRAMAMGVTELKGQITGLELDENDSVEKLYISSFKQEKRTLTPDFVFDCSVGSSAINEALGPKLLFENLAAPQSYLIAELQSRSSSPLLSSHTAHAFGWSKTSSLSSIHTIECFFHEGYSQQEVLHELAQSGLHIRPDSIQEKRVNFAIAKHSWIGNCVFLGKSSCCLPPLLHNICDLVEEQLTHFLKIFPSKVYQPHLVNFYNREVYEQSCTLWDVVNCHFHLSTWRDSSFWQATDVEVSDKLQHTLSLFEQAGIFPEYENQFIVENMWVTFLLGFNLYPQQTHPLAFGEKDVARKLASFHQYIEQFVKDLPTYDKYVNSASEPKQKEII